MAVVRNVQDLVAWQRANQFWEAVNPLLDRPGFRNDLRLRAQLSDALDSVLSNITEGFEQPTDRAFAKYLYNAKGSAAEARARLLIARKRRFITQEEHQTGDKLGDEVARIINGLIKYLRKSDRRDRGLGRQGSERAAGAEGWCEVEDSGRDPVQETDRHWRPTDD